MSLRMLFVLIVSLYTTRVILNVLGVDDYGIYNIVAGFVTMFAFLNTSMAGATQRYFNYELGKNGIEGANKSLYHFATNSCYIGDNNHCYYPTCLSLVST